MRLVYALFLFLLSASPALAYSPISGVDPVATYCDDMTELAVIVQAEGGAQPEPVRIRMAQIVLAESQQRGISICALSRLTNFVSVRHYARLHPDSWTAQQMAYARPESLRLAFDVLHGVYPDLRDGAMHFDGDGQHIIFRD